MTHGPRGNIVDLYTTLPWELLCEEVGRLRIDLRTGKVIAFPKAVGGGGGDGPSEGDRGGLLHPLLQSNGGSSKVSTSESKSAERFSGEGGIRTRGTLAGTHDFQSCTFGHSVTSPIEPAPVGAGASRI